MGKITNMTLKEFYIIIGGNYENAMSRIGSEDILKHVISMFPDDDNYKLLRIGLEMKKWDIAFQAAHTLKGICANLDFTPLETGVSILTEELRDGAPKTDITNLIDQINHDYQNILSSIEKFLKS